MRVVNHPPKTIFEAPYFASGVVLLEVWGHATWFFKEACYNSNNKGEVWDLDLDFGV